MLIAGASAGSTPAVGGALTFDVLYTPSLAWWDLGSAFMLVAGAGADIPSAWGGAFTFYVLYLPSIAWWFIGSAYNL